MKKIFVVLSILFAVEMAFAGFGRSSGFRSSSWGRSSSFGRSSSRSSWGSRSRSSWSSSRSTMSYSPKAVSVPAPAKPAAPARTYQIPKPSVSAPVRRNDGFNWTHAAVGAGVMYMIMRDNGQPYQTYGGADKCFCDEKGVAKNCPPDVQCKKVEK